MRRNFTSLLLTGNQLRVTRRVIAASRVVRGWRRVAADGRGRPTRGRTRGARRAAAAHIARPARRVKARVGLQVARRAEALVANIALVRLLARVHEMMFLQVGQLCEALRADVTMERPLARVRPQVHLEIRQLTKGFETNIALVMHLPVLLLQRIRQRSIAACAAAATART